MVALLFVLGNPRYAVQAVTVSAGEAHPKLFAGHVAQLLGALGRADIPVGYGQEAPLEGNNAFPEPWRRSSDGFFGVTLPEASTTTEPVPAADLIVETLSRSSQPMLVFLSGTHTNLAEALRLDPGIADRILGIHIMGGAVHVGGNIGSDWPSIHNKVAEWNIWVDPVAAHEVFVSGIPLHVVPLDATDQVPWTESDAAAWADSGAPEGALAAEILRGMLRSWSAGSVYLWDLVAATTMTDARLCPEVAYTLDVVTETGAEQGRTIVVDGPANAEVCLEPDADQIRMRAAAIFGQ
jgi:inosine-uridine nucleoside N-ribohydrolase